MALIRGKQLADSTVTLQQMGNDAVDARVLSLSGTYDFYSENGIVRVIEPSGAHDAASKNYVDSVAQGLQPKAAVRVMGSSPIGTPSGVQTIDGTGVIAGDRVLLTAQANAVQNGIWIVATAANWTRPADFASGSHAAAAFTFIEEGTTYHDTGWVCSTNPPNDVVQANDLAFVQFSSAGVVNPGSGLYKTGNDMNVMPGSGIMVGATVAVQTNGSTMGNSTSGIYVALNGITAAELNSSVKGNGLSAAGGGSAITVGQGSGIYVSANAVSAQTDQKTITLDGTGYIAAKLSGTGAIRNDGAGLAVWPETNGGLTVSSTGIKVNVDGTSIALSAGNLILPTGSVTAAKLTPSVAGSGITYGTDALHVGAGSGIVVGNDVVAFYPEVNGGLSVTSTGVKVSADGTSIVLSAGSLTVPTGSVIPSKLTPSVAGSGLVYGTDGLHVGAGSGIVVGNDVVAFYPEVNGGLSVSSTGVKVSTDGTTIGLSGGNLAVKAVPTGVVTAANMTPSVAGSGLVYGTDALHVGAGSGIVVGNDVVAFYPMVNGGLSVTSTGVGVSADGATITLSAGSLSVITVPTGSVTPSRLTPSVAGSGLVLGTDGLHVGAGSGIVVGNDVVAFYPEVNGGLSVSSTGVKVSVDGSTIQLSAGAVAAKLSSSGSIFNDGGGIGIKVDSQYTDPSVEVTSNGLRASVLYRGDQDLIPSGTSGQYANTWKQITETPAGDGQVVVHINGVGYKVSGSGAVLANLTDCFFASESTGTPTPREVKDIRSGDYLWWCGSGIGFQLDTTDRLSILYSAIEHP